jgi:GH24 family phage-related lysozyme (muramidase)
VLPNATGDPMKLAQLSTIRGATPLERLSKPQLTELQTALQTLGYPVNGVDGILGPATRGAWAQFKSDISSGDADSIGPGSVQTLQQRLERVTQPGAATAVPRQAVAIVKNYEGLRLQAYDDGVGVWTIGYGTTRYPNGAPVRRGDTATEAQAEQYLQNDIRGYTKKLAATIPFWKQMNDDQHAALISFAYNLGPGFYGIGGFETISAALRERRWSDVPAALLLYSMPGTNVYAGLLARRKAEGELWQGKGKYA